MMNYHEMTMDEPKDSPQKKMQFAVTCTIMASVLAYMLVTSGALLAVEPIQGKFPGGSYVYKFTARDYAASGGLGRQIMEELIKTQQEQKKEFIVQYKLEEQVHHLFLDDPTGKGGSRQRFASGLLIPKSKKETDETVEILMGLNDDTKRTDYTKEELHSMGAIDVFVKLPYETTELPTSNALVLQFPWTGGISSIMVQTMKVRPFFVVAGQYERMRSRRSKDYKIDCVILFYFVFSNIAVPGICSHDASYSFFRLVTDYSQVTRTCGRKIEW